MTQVASYKEKAWRENNYSEPYSEDFDLWWKIARKHELYHLNEVLTTA